MIPGLRKFPGGGHGNSLQYSFLENVMDREAWWAAVYGVVQSRTRLKLLSSSSSSSELVGASQVALVVKNPPANAGRHEMWVWSLGQEDSPGGGHGNSLQYPCLENPMDRGAWRAAVRGATKSQTLLSAVGFSLRATGQTSSH